MNKTLKQRLEAAFKHKGIVAYSACYRLGCTGSYESDEDFRCRENGIARTNGRMALGLGWVIVWLDANWGEELALINTWCGIVGLGPDDFTVVKPESDSRAIEVRFTNPLQLDREEVEMGDGEGEEFGLLR
jgi:hypothetical protein